MKRRRSRFHTGLIVRDRERFPEFPYHGKNWTARLAPSDPSLGNEPNVMTGKRDPLFRRNPELIICATHEVIALRALKLIMATRNLVNASMYSGPGSTNGGPCLVSAAEVRRRLLESDNYRRPFASSDDIPWACLIAAKASRKLHYTYAIFKWQLSASLFSVHYDDLHPYRRLIPKSVYPDEHIEYATAITLAYSAIEEIGFEVRANNNNPSSTNGEWNPVVLEDLEGRLTAGGIDLDRYFTWSVRGSKTRLEKHKPKQSRMAAKRAPWSKWRVRDGQVHIADGIAHASWLRSKVSSHKLKEEYLRVLSAYDVTNVQHLARNLILESLGYLRNHPNLLEYERSQELAKSKLGHNGLNQ
jgi:hypothetical protein